MLRLPGDLLDLLADIRPEVFLARRQPHSNAGSVSIRPGRFHHDPAQVRIAGLADRAALDPLTAAVLTRDCAAVTHQLRGFGEARDLSELGHNTHRGDL